MSIGAGGIRPCSLASGEALAVLIAFTGIVYIQDHLGWKFGFTVAAILMLLLCFLFSLVSPLYDKLKASKGLFTGFAQVVVVACKNREFPLFRFLNKACIIRNPKEEELRALIKLTPLWSTGMIMAINISLNSFPLLQASSISSSLQIPAGSSSTFSIIALIIRVILI
ncbi:protein NRT1/ PTR FAMILY 1.2 [Citrus sinensis]|nr:protein NRT1/ PTR FAMILY 1.2 [Citrus sinensis]